MNGRDAGETTNTWGLSTFEPQGDRRSSCGLCDLKLFVTAHLPPAQDVFVASLEIIKKSSTNEGKGFILFVTNVNHNTALLDFFHNNNILNSSTPNKVSGVSGRYCYSRSPYLFRHPCK